ncbi:hypothetical protein LIER_03588 [Lithospermum erythrorhizon]|uniref:Extradiol ring-cleavage dioxygenase class III enzyme subunit B domain-containing protein n=1 Tax=Lithospermum erythrorhizon TaxID=34254 RepID=A0AAV3NUV1_LITER
MSINQTFYISHGSPTLSIDDSLPARPFLLSFKDKVRVDVDKNRGLDHGAWVPLMLMYPEADIPVCGKALAHLKQDGSGSATHNLRLLGSMDSTASSALDFDNWLKEALLNGRYFSRFMYEDVNDYEQKAPSAKLSHPWPEHFYPLHVAMGAAGMDAKAELGNLSYASYKFEEKAK